MFTAEEKIFLARSEEFQKILADDEILKDLARMKADRRKECSALAEMARECMASLAGGSASGVLTPALWGFLWSLENHYTEDLEKITRKDTEIFLYLLDLGRIDLTEEECALLPELAQAFCREKNVDHPEAAALLIRRVRNAFQMLEILPAGRDEVLEEPVFDLYWLTALCSIAAAETGHSLTQIMFRMPLSLCFYGFIHHLRKQDRKGIIRRKSSTLTVNRIMDRVRTLGRRYADRCRRN